MTLNEIFKNTTYDGTLFSEESKAYVESKISHKTIRGSEVPYITCEIRKKEIKLTPEEAVRQLYIYKLMYDYGCPTSSIPIWLFPVLFWRGHSSRSPVSSVLPLFLPVWSASSALPSLPCTVLHCRKRSLCMPPWQAVQLPVPAPC